MSVSYLLTNSEKSVVLSTVSSMLIEEVPSLEKYFLKMRVK